MSQSRNQQENNPAWKGDKASYRAKHIWVQFHYGKADKCEFDNTHKSSRFHWSNISGQYLRDISDWQKLCPKCHKQFDKKTNGHNWKYGTRHSCSKGHEYTPENTRTRMVVGKDYTWRVCRECQKSYMKKYQQLKTGVLTV